MTSSKILKKKKPKLQSEEIEEVEGLEEALGADDAHDIDPEVFIPSRVPGLDAVLDREGRGWPAGTIVEIYGAEATCKTGFAYALMASVQKAGGRAFLFPAEGNLDWWLMRQYGIDTEKVEYPELEDEDAPRYGKKGHFRPRPDPKACACVEPVFEKCIELMEDSMSDDQVVVAVIDSVAGLQTTDEFTDDKIERDRDHQVRAQLISKSFRKIGPRIPNSKMILFLVNQVREGDGGMPGIKSKPKPPGGWAIRFSCSVRLRLEIIEKKHAQKDGMSYVKGFKLKITSEKNRMAYPFATKTILLDLQEGLKELPAKRKASKLK
jgi:recombination protein RecA